MPVKSARAWRRRCRARGRCCLRRRHAAAINVAIVAPDRRHVGGPRRPRTERSTTDVAAATVAGERDRDGIARQRRARPRRRSASRLRRAEPQTADVPDAVSPEISAARSRRWCANCGARAARGADRDAGCRSRLPPATSAPRAAARPLTRRSICSASCGRPRGARLVPQRFRRLKNSATIPNSYGEPFVKPHGLDLAQRRRVMRPVSVGSVAS